MNYRREIEDMCCTNEKCNIRGDCKVYVGNHPEGVGFHSKHMGLMCYYYAPLIDQILKNNRDGYQWVRVSKYEYNCCREEGIEYQPIIEPNTNDNFYAKRVEVEWWEIINRLT